MILSIVLFVPRPCCSLGRSDEQPRTLTFAERLAYQYAIEEVYWRHRIWPKENVGLKPSLDEVMSAAQIEKKVGDYLRNSQLVAERRGSPITAPELQAEMERMASHSKQADVLRELFAALGSESLVIAECLVRPIIAEQLVAIGSESFRAKARDPVEGALSNSMRFFDSAQNDIPETAAYKLPDILVPTDCTDDSWTATSVMNAPAPRNGHTAVWTGSEMIVWGGGNNFNTGGRYYPATDNWTATSTTDAPDGRIGPTAVWTGSKMVIWGGAFFDGFTFTYFDTGGRYDPAANSWTVTSVTNAPTARNSHTAIWTGGEMIVWGGSDNTGGRYNPITDSWTATSTTNAPEGRGVHTAVWTGSEMIIWGGIHQPTPVLSSGGRYNPRADSWTATSAVNAPFARYYHTAIWAGSEMIVWGGTNVSSDFNTGGRYNPEEDAWISTSTINAPARRAYHAAVWTGRDMIVWGGYDSGDLNTGGRYNVGANSWAPTGTATAPTRRSDATAVWTGNEMIVWGGYGPAIGWLNTGGRYCAQPTIPTVQSAFSRKTHSAAGTFDVNLPLNGGQGTECRSGGATSDYTIVITFLANVSVNGNPQATVSTGMGTIGSGGVSNGGIVITGGNVVTIPLTNIANAQTVNVTLNNVNGSTNVTIPMRILIGDVNGNGTVNASDASLTKSRIGQSVNAANFRADVNAGGVINASDVSLVKSSIGTALP